MPPKPKFTKDEVLAAALEIVRKHGEAGLTARALGAELGSSTRPLFTLFSGMEQIKSELAKGPVRELFRKHCSGCGDYSPAFKRYGMMIVDFAEAEPNLFMFLFLGSHDEPLTLEQWASESIGDEATQLLMDDFQLDESDASLIVHESLLHCFAICVLNVTNVVKLSEEEVSDSLSRNFIGLLSMAKSGRLSKKGTRPTKGGMADGESVGNVPVVPIQDPRND